MLQSRAFWWGVSLGVLPGALVSPAAVYAGIAVANAVCQWLIGGDLHHPGAARMVVIVVGGLVYGVGLGVLLPCVLFGATAHGVWHVSKRRFARFIENLSRAVKVAIWLGAEVLAFPIYLAVAFVSYLGPVGLLALVSGMPRALRVAALILLPTLVLLGDPAGAAPRAEELTVSVAVSMKEALEDLGRRFGEREGATVRFNFGASGDLEKQIEAGAPADVFVSAGQRQMDELEAKGLLLAGSRRAFARNVLVVITPVDSTIDLAHAADLRDARVRRIVIGNPRTVPVGEYAEQSLRALGLWDALGPKLVLAENVRQALDYVARGEVDAGFVYATDAALRRGRVKEAFRPPADTYRPVVYPVAIVKDTPRPRLARAFVDLLVGPDARATLGRLGFLPPPGGAR